MRANIRKYGKNFVTSHELHLQHVVFRNIRNCTWTATRNDNWSLYSVASVCMPLPLSYHHSNYVLGYKVSGTLIWRSTVHGEQPTNWDAGGDGATQQISTHWPFWLINIYTVSIPNFDLILNATNTSLFSNFTLSLSVILVRKFLYSYYLLKPSPIHTVYESEIWRQLGQWFGHVKPYFEASDRFQVIVMNDS